jgi:chitinase
VEYFGDDSVFGKTKTDIQQNLKQKYATGKATLLVSAFGPQEKPTSLGYSWQDCANGLASFVLENALDGADINWQDTDSLLSGSGEKWLINFHTHLRKLLPNHTIVHSPYAGYFSPSKYPSGSYSSINTEINKTTNFYNVQYFNQNTSKYADYTQIFI